MNPLYMELALLGGLAVLGYELSRPKPLPDNPTKEDHTIYELNQQFERDVASRYHDPNVVRMERFTQGNGVLDTAAPFFTSAKTQNSNSELKDRSLSTFTGQDRDMFKHKVETTPMFHVGAGATYVHGAPPTDIDRLKTYQSTLQNSQTKNTNLLPFEQQRVGRGLGIPIDQSVGGGFHDHFRILPDNVNSYRKNTFDGRVVSGKSTVDQRTVLPSMRTGMDTKGVYDMDRRPLEPTRAMIDGPAIRSDNFASCTNRGHDNPMSGIANGQRAQRYAHNQESYTRKDDRTAAQAYGNPSLARAGVGEYARSRFLTHDTDRETHRVSLNLTGPMTGGTVHLQDEAKATIRSIPVDTGIIGVRGHVVPQSGEYHVAPNSKEIVNQSTGYMGGSKGSGASYTQNYNANPTLRSTPQDRFNPAMAYLTGTSSYLTAYESEPYMSKEMTVSSYTPAASRVNVPLSHEYANSYMKGDNNLRGVTSGSMTKSTMNFNSTDHMGSMHSKDTSVPIPHDFNMARNQLKDNPLSIL